VVVKATKNADKSAEKNAPFGWVRSKSKRFRKMEAQLLEDRTIILCFFRGNYRKTKPK
jgi:hypothetical protein